MSVVMRPDREFADCEPGHRRDPEEEDARQHDRGGVGRGVHLLHHLVHALVIIASQGAALSLESGACLEGRPLLVSSMGRMIT
jgi:hypothetical protein